MSSLDDPAELEKTMGGLSDPEAPAVIGEADAAHAGGEVVRGVDAVEALGAVARQPYEQPRPLGQLSILPTPHRVRSHPRVYISEHAVAASRSSAPYGHRISVLLEQHGYR